MCLINASRSCISIVFHRCQPSSRAASELSRATSLASTMSLRSNRIPAVSRSTAPRIARMSNMSFECPLCIREDSLRTCFSQRMHSPMVRLSGHSQLSGMQSLQCGCRICDEHMSRSPPEPLINEIKSVLEQSREPLTALEISRRVKASLPNASKSHVNSALYACTAFIRVPSLPPTWFLAAPVLPSRSGVALVCSRRARLASPPKA